MANSTSNSVEGTSYDVNQVHETVMDCSNIHRTRNSFHYDQSTSAALIAKLNDYKYLDDYEYYRKDRLRQNAMKKFGIIMQTVKVKYKDCSKQLALEDGNESEVSVEQFSSDCSNFNQILKRHRKRFKQNLANRHHR